MLPKCTKCCLPHEVVGRLLVEIPQTIYSTAVASWHFWSWTIVFISIQCIFPRAPLTTFKTVKVKNNFWIKKEKPQYYWFNLNTTLKVNGLCAAQAVSQSWFPLAHWLYRPVRQRNTIWKKQMKLKVRTVSERSTLTQEAWHQLIMSARIHPDDCVTEQVWGWTSARPLGLSSIADGDLATNVPWGEPKSGGKSTLYIPTCVITTELKSQNLNVWSSGCCHTTLHHHIKMFFLIPWKLLIHQLVPNADLQQ